MSPIMTGYGFQSTAADVAEGADLSGRHAVVTGGTSPIGMETARELARAGAAVTLAVTDLAAGQHAAVSITAATGNPDVDVARLNLADPTSVTAFAEAWDGPLHLLINNAGITSSAGPHTLEGMEPQFAVNHLGHFALARALHRALAAADGARIVVVSSSAHLFSPIVFDDIHFTFRPYDPLLANAQSRTANVLFAVGASARWADDGITANALSPGAINTCRLCHRASEYAIPAWLRKTPQQAAATAVLLAISPLLEAIGGRYFTDCNEARPVARRPGSPAEISKSVAAYALEPANADRLWETSLRLLA